MKNLANVEKHDLDFDDVIVVFEDPGAFDYETVGNRESRSVRIGAMGDRVIAVVFVVRGEITLAHLGTICATYRATAL